MDSISLDKSDWQMDVESTKETFIRPLEMERGNEKETARFAEASKCSKSQHKT